MISTLFHFPFALITFLQNQICTSGSNPSTYIGYSNTFFDSGGVIEVSVKIVTKVRSGSIDCKEIFFLKVHHAAHLVDLLMGAHLVIHL